MLTAPLQCRMVSVQNEWSTQPILCCVDVDAFEGRRPVTEPIFWLGLSILLVAVSLTAVLVVALPALQELARAARSAQQLFDTLIRELPPTLEAIRLTGMEISDLTDDISEGVKSAGQVVKNVDRGIDEAKKRAQRVQGGTRRAFFGVRAAWKSLTRPAKSSKHLSSGEGEDPQISDRGDRLQLPEIETETEIMRQSGSVDGVGSIDESTDGEKRDRKQKSVQQAASQQNETSLQGLTSPRENRTLADPANTNDNKSSAPDAWQQNKPETIEPDRSSNANNQNILDSLIEDFSEETTGKASDDTTVE